HLRGGQSGADGEHVSVLFIADPGTPAALAERVAEYLPQRLRSRDRPERRWTTCVRSKPYLSDEQAGFADVIDAVDPSSEREDIVVYLTDLPRREDTLPVVADVAPTTYSRSSRSPGWAASTSSAASAPSPNWRSPTSSGNRN
ncbi:MAG: hypothetical protein ACRDTD_22400, partial [Pseudonocardiaceae bacterium]